jgi:hypothetical protein
VAARLFLFSFRNRLSQHGGPMFTGSPAVLQNLAFMKHCLAIATAASWPLNAAALLL